MGCPELPIESYYRFTEPDEKPRIRPETRTEKTHYKPVFHGVISLYRYYSPELGRWLSRDPIGGRGGWNLYAMARNNIINRVDVLGHQADDKKCCEGKCEKVKPTKLTDCEVTSLQMTNCPSQMNKRRLCNSIIEKAASGEIVLDKSDCRGASEGVTCSCKNWGAWSPMSFEKQTETFNNFFYYKPGYLWPTIYEDEKNKNNQTPPDPENWQKCTYTATVVVTGSGKK